MLPAPLVPDWHTIRGQQAWRDRRGAAYITPVINAIESDEAAVKLIWLQLREITKSWKTPAREWHTAKAQFDLLRRDRFEMSH